MNGMTDELRQRLEEREIEVPPGNLHPNPDNPRLEAGDVTELTRSIREQGLVQALQVRPAAEHGPGHYVIEAGYRRWVAMRSWAPSIRVHVRPLHAGESPKQRNLLVGLIENVHRTDLHPVEKARAFGRLRDELGMSQAEIARATGISATTVGNSLALLELDGKTQDRILAGRLTTEEALKIVRRTRRQRRKKATGGSGLTGARWDPDWFTRNHLLARKAGVMCDARGHNSRRRIGGIACGQCWETVMRQDEALVQQVRFQEQMDEAVRKLAAHLGGQPAELLAILGDDGAKVPYRPPWPIGHPMSGNARG